MRVPGTALVVTAGCAALFGGSFAVARTARDEDRSAAPTRAKSAPVVEPEPVLALGPSAPGLPRLRKSPAPKPAAPAPAPAAAASAPAPAPSPSPGPEPESQSGGSLAAPAPPPVSAPAPSPPNPSPQPASEPQPEVDFYDSGG